MAKSLRASSKKSTRSSLRGAVFSPVEDARTARLAQKLLDLASESKERDVIKQKQRAAKQSESQEIFGDSLTPNTSDDAMHIEQRNDANFTSHSEDRREPKKIKRVVRKSRSSTTFGNKVGKSARRRKVSGASRR